MVGGENVISVVVGVEFEEVVLYCFLSGVAHDAEEELVAESVEPGGEAGGGELEAGGRGGRFMGGEVGEVLG